MRAQEYKLKLITPPVLEPLTTAEAKAHLRVDFSDDDTVIDGYVKAAREMAEAYTWRAFLTQTWDLFLDQFPCGDRLNLPRPPLQSVTGVYYTPEGAAEQTWASSNYHVDTYGEPGGVVLRTGYTWPSDTLQSVNGVRVRFVAGWTAANLLPVSLVQGVKLVLGHFYENREGIVIAQGVSIAELPMGIQWVLDAERANRF